MKIIKKTKTETLITGVEITGKEFIDMFEGTLSIDLPMEEDDDYGNTIWESSPTWDTWMVEGTVKITFNADDEGLPRYKAPSPVKKKVTKKK